MRCHSEADADDDLMDLGQLGFLDRLIPEIAASHPCAGHDARDTIPSLVCEDRQIAGKPEADGGAERRHRTKRRALDDHELVFVRVPLRRPKGRRTGQLFDYSADSDPAWVTPAIQIPLVLRI